MTINSNIRDEELQYEINRVAVKDMCIIIRQDR